MQIWSKGVGCKGMLLSANADITKIEKLSALGYDAIDVGLCRVIYNDDPHPHNPLLDGEDYKKRLDGYIEKCKKLNLKIVSTHLPYRFDYADETIPGYDYYHKITLRSFSASEYMGADWAVMHIRKLQQQILKGDGFLPNVFNEDPSDCARHACFSASSCKSGGEPSHVNCGYSRKMGEAWNGWVSDGISDAGETLTMTMSEPKELSELRLTFWSDFKYPIRVTMAPNRQKQQRIGVPKELIKDYTVRLILDGNVVKEIDVRDNHQRLNVLTFDETLCNSVEILVRATNGHEDAVIFEIRAY